MKLTRTHQAMLADLAHSRIGQRSYLMRHGRGPHGGKLSGGSREYKAACDLVSLDLVGLVERSTWSEPAGGHTACYAEITIRWKGVTQ